jgi:hypothetical protein
LEADEALAAVPPPAPTPPPPGRKKAVEFHVAAGAVERQAAPSRSVERVRDELGKAEAVSPCAAWLDSGVSGIWSVSDAAEGRRQLDGMARDVGGAGLAINGTYRLLVPRDRFEEVFYALRARSIAGLAEPPPLPPGDGCVALAIVLAPAR